MANHLKRQPAGWIQRANCTSDEACTSHTMKHQPNKPPSLKVGYGAEQSSQKNYEWLWIILKTSIVLTHRETQIKLL